MPQTKKMNTEPNLKQRGSPLFTKARIMMSGKCLIALSRDLDMRYFSSMQQLVRKNINSRQSDLVDRYFSIPISVLQFESTYLIILSHHGFYRRIIQAAFGPDERLLLCLWHPICHHGLAIASTSGRRDAKRGGVPDDQR